MNPPPASDLDWLTLCVWSEAAGERADGQAAVARVVLNRAAAHYSSDGTIRGTVLSPGQFSGFYFDFHDGAYVRAAHTVAEAEARAGDMLAQAKQRSFSWAAIRRICDEVMRGAYAPNGPGYGHVKRDVVLYVNPKICHPGWARPADFACAIGAHSFYRADLARAAP